MRIATAITLTATAALGLVGVAQSRERLPRECRQELRELCGGARSQMRECLMERAGELSEKCQTEMRKRMFAKSEESHTKAMEGAPEPTSEIAFGTDPLQSLDFYAAEASEPAPLLLFVHGGGWRRGDKRNATGRYKAEHYTGQGYNFASVNYRLVPNATVEQQAVDVASSLAKLLEDADALGIDRSRVVLMGHSAGAHLVALVGTDPQYLRGAGLSLEDIKGVIPLDGAAYNVPDQMDENLWLMGDVYRQAFGTETARQEALSPTLHAEAPNAPAFLILHVQRQDGTRQSKALGEALKAAGTDVTVQGFEGRGLQGHAEINQEMGNPDYAATPVVDAWLKRVFG